MARSRVKSDGFIGLFVISPLALALLNAVVTDLPMTFVLLLVGLVTATLFFWSIFQYRDAFFLHANMFFLTFFFLFPAIFIPNVTFWGGAPTFFYRATGPITIALIWLSASSFGYYLSQKGGSAAARELPIQFIAPAFRGNNWILLILLGILIIYFASSPARFLTDRAHTQYLFYANLTSRSRDQIFEEFLPRAIAFATFSAAIVSLYARFTSERVLIVAIAAIVWLGYNNPISTPREILLSQVMVLVLLFDFSRRRTKLIWIGMIGVLFFIGPLVSYWSREYAYSIAAVFFHGADFDVYQNSVAFSRHISQHGFYWGGALARDFSFWLPAEYKPGSQDISIAVARSNGYLYTNISLPIFDELYADFGYIGLPIFSAVAGFIFGRFQGLFTRDRGLIRTPGSMAIIYFVASIIAILRGPLIGVLPYVALGSGSIFCITWVHANLTNRPLRSLANVRPRSSRAAGGSESAKH